MIRLSFARESRWLDLPAIGVRIKVKPLTTAVMEAFRSDAVKRIALLRQEAEAQAEAGFPMDPTGPNVTNPAWRDGLAAQMMAEGILRYAAEAWEGVAGEDGEPLPLDAASIQAFAAHDQAAGAFLREVLAPMDAVRAEGNGFAPSSHGHAGEGATTAPAAAMTDAPPVH